MADIDSSFVEVAENANKPPPKGTSRRSRQLERHGPKPAVRPNCRHPRNTAFMCGAVSRNDVVAFNADFYNHTSKIDQDNMVSKYLVVTKKKSKRRENAAPSRRNRDSCETAFYVRKQSKEVVRVCKDFFLKALALKRTRVENIAKHTYLKGGLRTENRGGDRKAAKYAPKKTAVRCFIKSLQGRESHYDRKKTKKLYLSPEMTSVKALWKTYQTGNKENLVSYEFFRRIFKREFRIGFGSPKTDACSMCERLKNELKLKRQKDPVEKQRLITELRIHKLRANAFYDLLAEKKEGLKTFAFDHQQNQVLPKVPDQIAYYSRQLYMYNFCVVENKFDGSLSPENVFIYTWKENDFSKNSSSCSSAVFHALNNSNLDGINTIRLVSDACGGQNKNSAFIFMACHWLTKCAPASIKQVEFLFPVRGHSFLPCDRVFGVLEKTLRKKERIYTPEEYIDVFSSQGTVRVAGKDWEVMDFKERSDVSLKKPLPIKIQENKRFILKREKIINVRAEPNYRHDLNIGHNIIKKGHTFGRAPNHVPQGVKIAEAKKADINKLMVQHVGEEWESVERFSFLASVVSSGNLNAPSTSTSQDSEEICDCLGEDTPLSFI